MSNSRESVLKNSVKNSDRLLGCDALQSCARIPTFQR
jgi:hypothetical protein